MFLLSCLHFVCLRQFQVWMLKVAGTVSSWSCWRPTCRQSLCNIPHTVWLWPSLFPLVHSWRWLGPLWRWLSCSARSSHLIRECRLRTSCRCLYKLDLNNIITALPTYHSITNIITALPTLSQHYQHITALPTLSQYYQHYHSITTAVFIRTV